MRFDLVDLRLFLHVAEAGNITQGALKANMALASASERIRAMEEILGVALLERGRRGVTPTPAGRALVPHARLVLRQIGQMRGELAEYAAGLKGAIRVLANTSASSEFLPALLPDFLVRHPNLAIDLEERPSYDIIRAVAEGSAEIGIVADIVDFEGLETFPFAVDRLVVVMPRGHPLARRRALRFQDLVDQEFVGLATTSALQQHLGQHAAQSGRPLKLRVRLNGFEPICRMVESGVGIAIVPETAALRCRKGMAIRMARLLDPWSLRHLTLCVRRLNDLPAPARLLVRHLASPGSKASA